MSTTKKYQFIKLLITPALVTTYNTSKGHVELDGGGRKSVHPSPNSATSLLKQLKKWQANTQHKFFKRT